MEVASVDPDLVNGPEYLRNAGCQATEAGLLEMSDAPKRNSVERE
jgi:hypothetical protein